MFHFSTKTLIFRIDYKNQFTHSTCLEPSCKMELPNYKEAEIMQKTSFEQNGGTYRMVGDYRIPNITLPAEASRPLGVWGVKRKDYLMQHKQVQFNIMLMNGTLWAHLVEIDEQSSAMFSRLVEQMKVKEGVTEQLKADNQMEWIARMNNIEARAREIVNHELIFTA